MGKKYTSKELQERIFGPDIPVEEQELLAQWFAQLNMGAEISDEEIVAKKQQSFEHLRELVEPTKVLPRSRRQGFLWVWGSVAAAMVLAVSVLLLNRESTTEIPVEEPTVTYIEVSTVPGQRKLLVLSDSSQVWLSNASTIRYPKQFAGGKREVTVEGQAFFEITPDKEKPFSVRTGALDIQVLGTSFDVKSYAEDENQVITVATGKVAVRAPQAGGEWLMEKGDQVVYNQKQQRGVKGSADLEEVLSWKSGELVFRSTPLGDIAIQLERWYGVKIHIATAYLANKELNLSVKNEPLNKVLDMLARAGQFDFEIQDKTVHIKHQERRVER